MVPEIDHHPQETVSRIVLQGIPWDVNSSFLRGAAQAPDHIREAFHSASTNAYSESGLDLKNHPLLEESLHHSGH